MKNILINNNKTKKAQYESLIPQLKGLLKNESDVIANMANIAAALKETFNFFWVGFYRVEKNELLLAPFQGPVACTRIKYGKGVCGTAWQQAEAMIVDDVEKFPGHIACNTASRSEIVIPIFQNKKVVAVLDVDSEYTAYFDNIDRLFLTMIVNLLSF